MVKRSLLIISILLFSFCGFSQKDTTTLPALDVYEKMAANGIADETMILKLANYNYFQKKYDVASKYYETLFEKNNKYDDVQLFYRYAICVKNTQKTDEIKVIKDNFKQKTDTIIYNSIFQEKKEELQKKSQEKRYEVLNLDVNSPESDYGSTIFNDELVFASSRKLKSYNTSQKDTYYTTLFVASKEEKGDYKKPDPLNTGKIVSKYNMSSPTFSSDGKTMYYTKNIATKLKDSLGRNLKILKLWKASLVGGVWSNEVELPLGGETYSTAHSALSPDQKRLYFASDMPGGYGDTDLYYVTIDGDKYSEPINLGSEINTNGKETFPFVSKDNKLYFSSDGLGGLGKLDIFVSDIGPDKVDFSKPINLEAPVNSDEDDFSFYIDNTTKTGSFSSNRQGGKGSDDIYKLVDIKDEIPTIDFSQKVFDKINGRPLEDVAVTAFSQENIILRNSKTDKNSSYTIQLPKDEFCRIRFDLPYYYPEEFIIRTTSEKLSEEQLKSIFLLPKDKDLTTEEITKTLEIVTIYFDFNSAIISDNDIRKLKKVLWYLKEYPNIKAEIQGHTDFKGSNEFNLELSQKRAQSSVDWLIENGIEKERLSAVGFGETKPINDCDGREGSNCAGEEISLNRRCEIKYTDL